MIRVFFVVLALAISMGVCAEEWYPQWKPISFADRNARVFYEKDPDPALNGEPVVWIYFVYQKPEPAKYFRQELFVGEIQEWVVGCSKKSASVATIRYTNDPYPEKIQRAAIVHPYRMKGPPSKEVALVCKLIT